MSHLRKYVLLAVVLSASLIVSCPGTEQGVNDPVENVFIDVRAAVPAGNETLIPRDLAGVIHTGYSTDLVREYGLLREMSSRWVHRDFSWSSVQPEIPNNPAHPLFEHRENIEWIANRWEFGWLDEYVQRANDEGKLVMGMLLYDTPWIHRFFPREDRSTEGGPGRRREVRIENQLDFFVEYAVRTVQRYNRYRRNGGYGKVHAWFIWNEPCLQPRFWTYEQEDFFELTRRTAAAIRQVEPHAVLVGGVFSVHALLHHEKNWVRGLFESGAMEYLDGIGFHPYGPNPNAVLNFFTEFKDQVYRYQTQFPAQGGRCFVNEIWLNEIGFPTFPDRGPIPPGRMGTDQYEGNMPEVVTKTFSLLAAAGARNIMWYHMFDRYNRDHGNNFNNSERWFGLVWQRPDGYWQRKGGYWGYALSARHLPGKTYKEMNFFPDGSAPRHFQTHYFAGENGRRVLLVWNDCPQYARDVTITLGPNASNRRVWNVDNGSSRSVGVTSSHRLHPVDTFRQTLVFMTWDENED
ncbi:MAG: hypothetical protein FWB78_05595 [Treponema sp.]|nr:hypothetical protein [Treponema sp.]